MRALAAAGWLAAGLVPAALAQFDALASMVYIVSSEKAQLKTANPARRADLSRDIERNLRRIEDVGSSRPDDARAQAAVARALLDAGEPRRALAAADRAVALAPDSAEALSVRAMANLQGGRREQAVADASAAERLEPGNQTALTVLRFAGGRTQAAAAPAPAGPAPAARAIDGSAAKPAFSDAELAAEAQRQRTAAQAALAADRAKVEGLVTEASSQMKLGDRDGAGRLLDRALALEPADGRLHALKALTLLRPGADAATAREALAHARQGVAAAPRSATAQVALARALEATGASPDEVLAAYRAAAQADPAFASEYAAAVQSRDAGRFGSDARSAGAAPAEADGSAPDPLFGRLADAARRGWPWLSVAAGLAFAAWSWLAKRQLS